MRIDSPLMTNAIATGSFSGSFAGTLAYDDITSKPALISSSAQITAFGFSTTDNELNQEEVEDFAGALVATGGTKTGITVTYDDVNGNMDFVVASQTDENFTTADHAKLDAIEASATADQTDAEIRAAVEAATDSNVFTDADHSKLNAIEASADVTDATNVTAAGALMDSEVTDLTGIKGVTISTLQVKPSEGAFADGDKTKLDAIEASATADQTDAEIRTAVEAASDSNVFTDADHSKLNAIEASADVTDTANVTAAGALMDSECTNLAALKAINQGLATGNDVQFNDLTVAGDLTVTGTTTSINSTDLDVTDKLISINKGGADAASANGGGLFISGANESMTWDNGNSRFNFSDDLHAAGNFTLSGTVDGRDVASDGTKLDGIEASATADQTDAEIRAAVEAATDSNVFTDADHSKLNAIEASADVTDTTNVTAAGALMDSECTSLASVKAINQGLTTSSDVSFDSIGIGTAAPGTSGVIRASNDIIAFYSSDERLKDNIEVIPNCLGRLKDIKGVEFDWNDKQSVYQGHDIGVIAQDIEKIAPSLVTDRDNGFKAVKYEKLTAILIQAVKELAAKVEELENK